MGRKGEDVKTSGISYQEVVDYVLLHEMLTYLEGYQMKFYREIVKMKSQRSDEERLEYLK